MNLLSWISNTYQNGLRVQNAIFEMQQAEAIGKKRRKIFLKRLEQQYDTIDDVTLDAAVERYIFIEDLEENWQAVRYFYGPK